MIRIYDPTLVDLTNNVFVLCTKVQAYLYNYSLGVELSMNIHEGKGLTSMVIKALIFTCLTHLFRGYHYVFFFISYRL